MSGDHIWLALASVSFVAAQVAWCFMFHRWQLETQEHVDEVRRCNDEFCEAVALMKYGAMDEAIEVASRWKARAAIGDA